MYSKDWGEDYGIASCYNSLPLGGGGLTLGRLNLKKLGDEAGMDAERFLEDLLPRAVAAQCEQMDGRCRYIIDDCAFFENSFLAWEGLYSLERFVGMFGLVGVAECVNTVLGLSEKENRFGHNEEAAAFAEKILDTMNDLVTSFKPKYGKFYLHGQVGISDDFGTSPGTRIPIGEEPSLPKHLNLTARLQKHFACGTGDLFPFESTAERNPEAILDIIKGSFDLDTRYISFYSSDSDLIRVTGYLVKRSDVEKYKSGQAVLTAATDFAAGAIEGLPIYDRKVRNA